MIPDNCWLDPDWFDDVWYRVYDNLKAMLVKRGFRVYDRKRLAHSLSGMLKTEGELSISILRDRVIFDMIANLIHEFCHYELGHREMEYTEENGELAAKNEIECLLVTEVICQSLGITRLHEVYIYRFPIRITRYVEKAIPIAAQVGEWWI